MLLTVSDLVSGGLCVAYDKLVLKKGISAEKFTEQVVYRSLGRIVNERTNLPQVNVIVTENDVLTGALAVVDSMVRSGQSTNASLYDGLRAVVASYFADQAVAWSGMSDKVLL